MPSSRKPFRSSESVPLRSPGERSARPAGCVLLIDDDDEAREELTRELRARGWHVVVASDVKGAIARAADEQPNAIVSELLVVDAHGYGFVRALKTMVEHDVPVIGVTRAGSGEFERAREAGFAAVLGKPVDAATLDALLRASLVR